MKSAKHFFYPYFIQSSKQSFKNLKSDTFFETQLVHSEIKNQKGELIYSKFIIAAPSHWSQTAVDIAASKYFRKNISSENSIFKLVQRIGLGIETSALMSKIFSSKKEIQNFRTEIEYHLLNQTAAFNSPVWFNCGLHEAYKIKSASQHFAWDQKKKKIEPVIHAYQRPQLSACFIQSVEDSLESIFDLVKSEAKLFKYGSGSGTNFSNLRSKYEQLNTGGTSSGLISFLQVLDQSAGAIKSGGTTRRAAKMVCVDVDHPEILDFINWKKNEERKAKALIQAGYSADLNGEAYNTVSGQNANNSIRISNSFMKAFLEKKSWALKTRLQRNKTIQEIPAEKIWSELCQSAWECADPGVQFNDVINEFHTCADTSKINASNPCSEYMFIDDSACNLASLNLTKFFGENYSISEFRIHEFLITVKTFILAQECFVDYASYPTTKIAQNSHDYRPLGLGFANLGSLIMRLGLSYDSDQARALASAITALMTGMAYYTSSEIAQKIGPFPEFKKNKKSMMKVIKKHQKSLSEIDWSLLPVEFKAVCFEIWDDVIKMGNRHGFRNAQVTAIAPTGTIGLIMDCDTTGIEPEYSLVKYKKLSGGGSLKIVNQSVKAALQNLGYHAVASEQILLEIAEKGYCFGSRKIKPEHQSVFATAVGINDQGDGALSAVAHLKMMAAVQKFISGAISKTVNLPKNSTVQDISDVYLKAWQLGLKSVAIYRDGSKYVQPLNSFKKLPQCVDCGGDTIVESGCYRCVNCGASTACS